jgi:diguanylate cyclase (GGDEF)-like protein
LTGLFTKRHFSLELARQCAQSRRTADPLTLLLFDIDHFKRVNDTHGHLAGDKVLSEVARTLRDNIREYDLAFRFGGEELVVLAPHTGLEEGLVLAERLRSAIAGRSGDSSGGPLVPVTTSVGVAAFSKMVQDPDALVEAADRALYRAKQQGRNRVEAHVDAVPPGPPTKAPDPGRRTPPSAPRNRTTAPPPTARRI